MRKKTPTFGELLQTYPRIAAIERAKNERPCEATVANTLHGVRAILRGLEGDWAARAVTDLSRRRIDTFLGEARARGLAPVSAWSYLLSLRALARCNSRRAAARGLCTLDISFILCPFTIRKGRPVSRTAQ